MIDRKKKLRTIQITLLLLGAILLLYTYSFQNKKINETIIQKQTLDEINQDLGKETDEENKFFDITYTNVDLNGNRYILKSKEAETNANNTELVLMKDVTAIFYFNDNTILNVFSDKGVYNNKTLDMKFDGNIKANYIDSKLFADQAEYSNTGNFLSIKDNVTVVDKRGRIKADRIFFDLKENTVDIESFNNKTVNATINRK